MISIQEMFNRAYIGLRSQGFRRCVAYDKWLKADVCVYNGPGGMHCAWGWVDTNIPANISEGLSVWSLNRRRIGVASELDDEGLKFADKLQRCHDSGTEERMKRRLHILADEYGLTIPPD